MNRLLFWLHEDGYSLREIVYSAGHEGRVTDHAHACRVDFETADQVLSDLVARYQTPEKQALGRCVAVFALDGRLSALAEKVCEALSEIPICDSVTELSFDELLFAAQRSGKKGAALLYCGALATRLFCGGVEIPLDSTEEGKNGFLHWLLRFAAEASVPVDTLLMQYPTLMTHFERYRFFSPGEGATYYPSLSEREKKRVDATEPAFRLGRLPSRGRFVTLYDAAAEYARLLEGITVLDAKAYLLCGKYAEFALMTDFLESLPWHPQILYADMPSLMLDAMAALLETQLESAELVLFDLYGESYRIWGGELLPERAARFQVLLRRTVSSAERASGELRMPFRITRLLPRYDAEKRRYRYVKVTDEGDLFEKCYFRCADGSFRAIPCAEDATEDVISCTLELSATPYSLNCRIDIE